MHSDANVWTVDAAVDEVMRLRRLVRSLERREQELRDLVDEYRRRAQAFASPVLHNQLYWAADQLNVRLMPPETFKAKEPGQ